VNTTTSPLASRHGVNAFLHFVGVGEAAAVDVANLNDAEPAKRFGKSGNSRNVVLDLAAAGDKELGADLAMRQYETAHNMTEQFGALSCCELNPANNLFDKASNS